MSDQRLRELERRFKESGSFEDEVRYLLQLARAGGLPRERLELAAYLGHGPARLLPGPFTEATRHVLRSCHEHGCIMTEDPPRADLPERVLRALEGIESQDWIARAYTDEVRKISGDLGSGLGVPFRWPGVPPASSCPLCRRFLRVTDWVGGLRRWGRPVSLRSAVALAGVAQRSSRIPSLLGELRFAGHVELIKDAIRRPRPEHERALEPIPWLPHAISGRFAGRLSNTDLGEEPVRRAVMDALIPWVLGRGDPLA